MGIPATKRGGEAIPALPQSAPSSAPLSATSPTPQRVELPPRAATKTPVKTTPVLPRAAPERAMSAMKILDNIAEGELLITMPAFPPIEENKLNRFGSGMSTFDVSAGTTVTTKVTVKRVPVLDASGKPKK